MIERTDPLAATVAENGIYDVLQRRVEDDKRRDPRSTAQAVVDGFYATFEYRDGQRRVVLASPWEVDPAAHAKPVPVFVAAGQG